MIRYSCYQVHSYLCWTITSLKQINGNIFVSSKDHIYAEFEYFQKYLQWVLQLEYSYWSLACYPTPGCENQGIWAVVSKAVDTTGPNLHIGYNTLIA